MHTPTHVHIMSHIVITCTPPPPPPPPPPTAVNPQPTGFIIGSTTYPSTLDTNANYLHDPSQGSPLSPKITCPLPTPSSTIDIQWTLTDLSTLRNHTLSTAVCPCDIGGGVFADVVTDGLSSSVVFGPMFPDEGRYTLSCSLLALEHTVTLYNGKMDK